MRRLGAAIFAIVSVASAVPTERHLVYRETGRLGGWPANHGIWNWGDEILVGFSAAWHQVKPSDRHQQDQTKPEEPRLARSLDGGVTWTIEAPRELLPPAQGGRAPRELREPMDFRKPGFAMTIRFLDTNKGPSLLWYSYDRGHKWEGPFSFPNLHAGVLARTDYAIDGPKSATVFLSESKANGLEGRPFCARTEDGGVTWKFVSYIGPEPSGFVIMPATVRVGTNGYFTAVRVHDGATNRIDSYRSNDNGATWQFAGGLADTGELGGNPPSLVRLQDGRLCLTYGFRNKPYSIRARLSSDDGKHWGEVTTIRDNAAAFDVGYPRTVQRADGKMVTVYYFNDAPHNERFVEATIWDPGSTKPTEVSSSLDLHSAAIVSDSGAIVKAQRTAAIMLGEEIAKRTGLQLAQRTAPIGGKPSIRLHIDTSSLLRAEGYRIHIVNDAVQVDAKDARGVLFGAGNLLRMLDMDKGKISIQTDVDLATSPKDAIRGHQLGYRAQANSYDAWNVTQFEQYIRELTFFGVNSVEGIPFHDDRETPVMKTPRREINRAIGEICDRYGLDYWAWIPADFDLKDAKRRSSELQKNEEFFRDAPQLTGVFFPGGDPGNNPPELVLPYLEDMARLMRVSHPKAKIWLSLQWFTPTQVDGIYRFITDQRPNWLGGLVGGPSSPPIPETRARLPKQYGLRDYPDLTHNKLSQYEVPSWDQAFAFTLGREAINPRPAEYALIHNRQASYTDGFISYSDGVHDDVNKTIWSALAWNPDQDVRQILQEYSRVYFQSNLGGEAADGIFALERNWRGPLLNNGAVEGTLLQWQKLESRVPQLEKNWRWQMCLLRAYYDAYLRHRLVYETDLENRANAVMADAPTLGATKAIRQAEAILDKTLHEPVSPELRDRIVDLCDELFTSIGLQTSMERYFAINEQRGAVLDFVDRPLNNRWWLDDQFNEIRRMGSEQEKVAKLVSLAKWEHPGPGSFYDDIGNVANQPHAIAFEQETAPDSGPHAGPTYWWWDNGWSRARLSWQTTAWPEGLVYEGLDPRASYVVRQSGFGGPILKIDGQVIPSTSGGKEIGDIREFPIDPKWTRSGKLILHWEQPSDEASLNWRNRSRVAEVWLIRKP